MKIKSSVSSICIIAIYRAPSSHFKVFIDSVDNIIKKLYKKGLRTIVLCGDFNINYPSQNDMRKQLDAMLISYNLTSIVDFPTRVQNNSCTEIDNIFINALHSSNFLITPMTNGLADNDAHLLTITEINLTKQTCPTKTIRNVNKNSIMEFHIKLSYELWDNVFSNDNDNNVDILFNSFLNSCLRVFYSSFPTEKLNNRTNKKPWIKNEMKVMCHHKKTYIYLVGVALI
jgi:hypothetical protein